MTVLTLQIVEGPQAGRRIELRTIVEVGRGQGVLLDDNQVSRRHARISPAGQGAVIEDLGSTNGTFVNGNQIYSPTMIEPGDEVLIGVTLLRLLTGQAGERKASAVRAVPPALAAPAKAPDYIPSGQARETSASGLDSLLDVRVKSKAKMAPLAIFILVVLVVLVYVASTRG